MKRLILLLFLPALACSGLSTPPPAAPTSVPVTETLPPPPTETVSPSLTAVPATAVSPDAAVFPDAGAYQWEQIVSGLQRPTEIQNAGDGSGRVFVIEKAGRIRILLNGQLLAVPFLDISDRVHSGGNEQGLLGLTFDPDYKNNGFFYVNYTGSGGTTHIARFQATQDPNFADPNSEMTVLTVGQPFPNHNGGALAFGPDGYLYAGLGDGGSAGDPFGNGQNTNVLLGKILRLDVTQSEPYVIPFDNPFGNEVWAYGLRNPWRISFDRVTGDLWIGDVGQNNWEEVDYLPAGSPGGANFGWNIVEGNHEYAGQAQPDFIAPVAEYGHDTGCSVTGGYVYRGTMPEWQGIYLYGDYCSGTVWGLIRSGDGFQSQALFEPRVNITSFGEDEAGEVYLASDSGDIYRLTAK